MQTKQIILVVTAVLILTSFSTVRAQDLDKVLITSVKLTDNIYMLQGAGGNIGLSFGSDGIFIIDDQFAPLHEKIIAKIDELTGSTVSESANTFLLNTQFHPDHTGGNELMGKTGAIIIAHDNVRNRITVEHSVPFFNMTSPPVPEIGLPAITFEQDITLHLNGDDVNIIHVGPAHTDGDAIVHFSKADVIHGGDTIWGGMYPFIDLSSGGSIDGMIESSRKLLALADDETRLIPGHGPPIGREELQSFFDMLTTIRDAGAKSIEAGNDHETTTASKPTAGHDAAWGQGFIKPDQMAEFVYKSLTEK